GGVDDAAIVRDKSLPRRSANDTGSFVQSRLPSYQVVAAAAAAPAAASTPANFAAQAFWQSSATAYGRNFSNSPRVFAGGLSALSRSSSATLRYSRKPRISSMVLRPAWLGALSHGKPKPTTAPIASRAPPGIRLAAPGCATVQRYIAPAITSAPTTS